MSWSPGEGEFGTGDSVKSSSPPSEFQVPQNTSRRDSTATYATSDAKVEPGSPAGNTNSESTTLEGSVHNSTKRKTAILLPLFRKAPTRSPNADDYDKKYPEDAHGQEFMPNSRVYKVYLEEAAKRDEEAIDSWRDSLDVLLIFAGLFSAVVTTFVVQVSSRLQPDYGEMNAYLQVENNALLRAIASGSSPSDIPISSRSPYDDFKPARSDAWVNGLWYLSLTLSLSVALITVLVKQWLKYYASFIPGSPQDRARLIEARRRAADFWRLTAIIGTLPLLLHASVFVFFAGLAQLLSAQNTIISDVIIAIICLTALFYAITTILPLIFPHCTYVTPLTLSLYAVWCSVHTFWSAIAAYCVHLVKHSLSKKEESRAALKKVRKAKLDLQRQLKDVFRWHFISQAERIMALQDVDLADVNILQWLRTDASLNPSVPPIVCEAISGIHEGFNHLSAIRRFSRSISKDWKSEITHLMSTSQFPRVERYLRMNAVLYTPHANFSVLHSHPHLIGAIIATAFSNESPLAQFSQIKMTCCGFSFDATSDYLDHSYWTHALLSMVMSGFQDSEFAATPMVKLHPGTWINVFSYLSDLSRSHLDGGMSERTSECARRYASSLLKAILNRHYEQPEEPSPYFAEERCKKNNKNKNAVDLVSILEIPPGHCRMRLLQFLYVYSKPTLVHQFTLYTDFLTFTGNIVELWHKALLLHLKQYEAHEFPLDTVGVLRELAGVIRASSHEELNWQIGDCSSCQDKLRSLQHRPSALVLEVGAFVHGFRTKLKEALVKTTLDVLTVKARNHMLPFIDGPKVQPLATTPSALAFAIPEACTVVGVQLVSLIEVLRKSQSTNKYHSPHSAARQKTSSEMSEITIVGQQLLEGILQRILQVDRRIIDLIEKTPRSPSISQYDGFSSPPTKPRSLLLDMELEEFRRSLELGSRMFIEADAIDVIFCMFNQFERTRSSLRREQLLWAAFRAAQILASFVNGVINMDEHCDILGRTYLCAPETLNKCCFIMVQAEFALFTLNAAGVDDKRCYAILSRYKPLIRTCLDRWWENILTLTQKYPEDFAGGWRHVFGEQTLHPRRPAEVKAHVKPASLNKSPHSIPPAIALYRKKHYLWIEDIMKTLDMTPEKFPQFQPTLVMMQEEFNHLPPFTRWRHTHSPPPQNSGTWITVDFALVKDDLGESLNVIEEARGSDLGNLLVPLLNPSLKRPSYEPNSADVEAAISTKY